MRASSNHRSRWPDTLLPCAAGTRVSQRRRCSTSTLASGIRPEEATDIALSWNVAPQTMQPVVRIDPEMGVKEIVLMRWGLVPFFAKLPTHNYSTINAMPIRSEGGGIFLRIPRGANGFQSCDVLLPSRRVRSVAPSRNPGGNEWVRCGDQKWYAIS
jgi:SOS response associated peptidase (SRAP)